jgi:hypothetical protein
MNEPLRLLTPPDDDRHPQVLLRGVESPEEARAIAGDALTVGDRVVLHVDSLWCAVDLEGIVHALRDYIVALDCDYDGYLYSFICTFQQYPQCILPDRSDMTVKTHFLSALSRHLIGIGRRRGIRVQGDGIDEQSLVGPNEQPLEVADLIQVPRGRITRRGMRHNIRRVLSPDFGEGSVKLACAQLWQWVRHETGVLDVGQIITAGRFDELLEEQLTALDGGAAVVSRSRILRNIVLDESFTMRDF